MPKWSLTRRASAGAVLTLFAVLGQPAKAQSTYYDGQTFTAPSTSSVSLTWVRVGHIYGYAYNNHQLDIFAYSGNQLTGSSLFTSALAGAFDGDTLTFAPNVALTPGGVYALTISNPYGSSAHGDTFAGGAAIGCGVNGMSSTECAPLYDGVYAGYDVSNFSVRFGSSTVTTPEPSSVALLGTGLLGLAPVVLRRRR